MSGRKPSPSESIFNWIEREEVAPRRGRRYKSVHDPKRPPVASTFVPSGTTRVMGANLTDETTDRLRGDRRGRGGMGRPADEVRPDPRRYLLKHEKMKPVRLEDHKAAPAARTSGARSSSTTSTLKARVPRRSERPVMGMRTEKNYVVANAVENILAVPPKRRGGAPVYRTKTDFGKVPEYLGHVKAEIEDERKMVEDMYMDQLRETREAGPQSRGLPEGERLELLDALKAKWDDVNRKYQQITHLVKPDTRRQLQMKEEYERLLAQIERDIAVLSQKRPIQVVDDRY